jgi:hypothetical protein
MASPEARKKDAAYTTHISSALLIARKDKAINALEISVMTITFFQPIFVERLLLIGLNSKKGIILRAIVIPTASPDPVIWRINASRAT